MKERAEFGSTSRKDLHIYEESTELLKRAQELSAKIEIGKKEAVFKANPEYPDLPIALWHATDIHYGSIRTDYQTLDAHWKILEDTPNFYVATNGDDVDNFNITMKAASGVYEDPLSPGVQTIAYMEKIKKLDEAKKIAVMSFGNHNNMIYGAGYEWLESFARDLNTNIFTSGGFLHTLVGDEHYGIALTHMYWGNSKINPTNMGKRFWEHEYPQADIVLLGHTHQSELLEWERGGKERIVSIGGTYKYDDRHSRQWGIGGRAGKPGHTILLYPHEHKMEGYKHIEEAQQVMLDKIFRKEHEK